MFVIFILTEKFRKVTAPASVEMLPCSVFGRPYFLILPQNCFCFNFSNDLYSFLCTKYNCLSSFWSVLSVVPQSLSSILLFLNTLPVIPLTTPHSFDLCLFSHASVCFETIFKALSISVDQRSKGPVREGVRRSRPPRDSQLWVE